MGLPAFAANYLFLAPLIVQRLQLELGQDMPVEPLEQLDQAREAQDLRGLVIYVLWAGDRVLQGEQSSAGSSQRIDQQWMVLVRVRNASVVDKAGRDALAGPVMARVHRAMHAWKPEGLFTRFMRAPGARPDYQPQSGLYPLTFSIQLAL